MKLWITLLLALPLAPQSATPANDDVALVKERCGAPVRDALVPSKVFKGRSTRVLTYREGQLSFLEDETAPDGWVFSSARIGAEADLPPEAAKEKMPCLKEALDVVTPLSAPSGIRLTRRALIEVVAAAAVLLLLLILISQRRRRPGRWREPNPFDR